MAIIGGGLAGGAAAIAASRCGAKATLIEQSGVLGGQATLGIVTPLSATGSVSGESFGGKWLVFQNERRYEAHRLQHSRR